MARLARRAVCAVRIAMSVQVARSFQIIYKSSQPDKQHTYLSTKPAHTPENTRPNAHKTNADGTQLVRRDDLKTGTRPSKQAQTHTERREKGVAIRRALTHKLYSRFQVHKLHKRQLLTTHAPTAAVHKHSNNPAPAQSLKTLPATKQHKRRHTLTHKHTPHQTGDHSSTAATAPARRSRAAASEPRCATGDCSRAAAAALSLSIPPAAPASPSCCCTCMATPPPSSTSPCAASCPGAAAGCAAPRAPAGPAPACTGMLPGGASQAAAGAPCCSPRACGRQCRTRISGSSSQEHVSVKLEHMLSAIAAALLQQNIGTESAREKMPCKSVARGCDQHPPSHCTCTCPVG